MLFACAFLLPPFAAAEPGIRGASFLKNGDGPRAAAMGEAQTAVADDSYASYWNPAALARFDRPEAAMTVQRSFQDLQEQQANVVLPLRGRSGIGFYLARSSIRPFDGFDARGNAADAVGASDAVYGIAYGYPLLKSLAVGGGVKVLQSQLGPSKASSYAFDGGVLMQWPSPFKGGLNQRVRLGLTAQDLGPALVYDQETTALPRLYRLGFGYDAPVGPHHLTVAADYNFSPDLRPYVGLGQEFWFWKAIALRAGYRFGPSEASGPRVGIAVNVNRIQVAYGLAPLGVLGTSQRVGLSYRFGTPPAAAAGSPLLAAPAPPMARPLTPPAPVPSAVQQSTPSVNAPTPPAPTVVPETAPAPRRAPAATRQRPAKPAMPAPPQKPSAPAAPVPADVPALLRRGNADLQAGRFQRAAAAFAQALKMEPNNQQALDLMRKALSELDRQKKRAREVP